MRTNRVLMLSAAFLLFLTLGCCRADKQLPDLDSYSWQDLGVFRSGLQEDELASHPELAQAAYYRLRLELSEDLSVVAGRLRVLFTNRSAAPLERIPFFLYPNLTPGRLRIAAAAADGLAVEFELEQRDSWLVVNLPRPLEPGQSSELSLEYSVSVPPAEKGEYGGFGLSGGVLSLAYAYPMIPAAGGWQRSLPVRHADFLYNEVSFYLAEISMPSRLELVAPGVELGRRLEQGRTTVLLAFGPARDLYLAFAEGLSVQTERVGKTLVRSYTPADGAASSRQLLAVTAEACRRFGERFGPYPYTTLSLVSVPFSSYGLEFPGVILLARRLYDSNQSVDGIPAAVLLESTAAHEAAHQWFYGSVGNDQVLEPWLDEALAQYATWLYYRDRYGESAAAGFFRSFEDRWNRVEKADIPIGLQVSEYSAKEYGAIVYGRGPLFIQALARTMGEESFDRFLREYCRRYEWEVATGADFQAAAEAVCGCELDGLFAEWVTGRPRQ